MSDTKEIKPDPVALLMRINRLETEIDALRGMLDIHTKYINRLLSSMPALV